MKNVNLKNKTMVQLKTRLNVKKTFAIVSIAVVMFLTVISIYGLFAKDNIATFVALFAVACTSWSFLPIPFDAMKEIKVELKSRQKIN